MKIEKLMKMLDAIKGLQGDIDLYDISEYRGKTFLDFKSDFPPYEVTYTYEEVKGSENEFSELYVSSGDNKPTINIYCMTDNGGCLMYKQEIKLGNKRGSIL